MNSIQNLDRLKIQTQNGLTVASLGQSPVAASGPLVLTT